MTCVARADMLREGLGTVRSFSRCDVDVTDARLRRVWQLFLGRFSRGSIHRQCCCKTYVQESFQSRDGKGLKEQYCPIAQSYRPTSSFGQRAQKELGAWSGSRCSPIRPARPGGKTNHRSTSVNSPTLASVRWTSSSSSAESRLINRRKISAASSANRGCCSSEGEQECRLTVRSVRSITFWLKPGEATMISQSVCKYQHVGWEMTTERSVSHA